MEAPLKKGPWTSEEDQKLLAYIEKHGPGSWRTLPSKAGLQRCGKSCRLRWTNYLRPDIRRGKFSPQEEKALIRLHALLGNRWSAIAAHLPKRTDNEIKNYWNTRLKKRLTRMGIDPVTHKPKNNPPGSAHSRHAAALSHMAQWETARLEAEARLARDSKLVRNLLHLRKATAPPPPSQPKILGAPPCLDVLKVWQATTIPGCLFSPPGTLESPTFTLNFSSNCLTVPTVGSNLPNDVISTNNYGTCGVAQTDREMEGKMENSLQLQNDSTACPMSYDFSMLGLMDHDSSFIHDSDVYKMSGPDVVELEGSHYWNDLQDLLSSTMEWPMS